MHAPRVSDAHEICSQVDGSLTKIKESHVQCGLSCSWICAAVQTKRIPVPDIGYPAQAPFPDTRRPAPTFLHR